ncbi:Na(+)-translocating NADH-quinone reductase subunit C [Alcanivorax sp. S71-1-4]|uniref:Na(+)-translocating NADH-quinone reductase subunit C n=1 Tax=Alcanivorax sp. S71-1-4 TaxID=1177159 RepID=UPI00135C6738|nr:Na(+)-translocating NADH-quinone reductase subunit C [Alcanivorax sp. S71-1-4]KAF0809442.1 Na(+)-translocating NADH-quinone reductase subunit C [Alcanivorax sp. S71-1-4]
MAANKDSVTRTLLVALILCLVCAVVVSTAAVQLRPKQQANQVLDRQVNILRAAGMYQPGMDVQAEFEKMERRFVELSTGEYVDMPASYDQRAASRDPEQSVRLDGDTDIASIRRQAKVAEVYLSRDDNGDLTSIILPVHGYGLWSTLYGFLSLEPDAETVKGLVFYEHAETPGLGGEVDNPRWRGIWEGKALFDEQGNVAIQVIKGSVDGSTPDAEHKVDGLSGATLTSNGVSNLVRFWVGENGFGPYLERVRRGDAAQN